MALGRPPRWETVEDLEKDIQKYLDHCKENNRLIHRTGFAVFIGCSRSTMHEYITNKGPGFSSAIDYMMQISEDDCANVIWKTKEQTYGKTLVMKNIHKWQDRVETEDNRDPKEVAKELKALLDQAEDSVLGGENDAKMD